MKWSILKLNVKCDENGLQWKNGQQPNVARRAQHRKEAKKRKKAVKTKGKARRHLLNPLKGREENFHMVLRCHILMFFSSSSSSSSFLSLSLSRAEAENRKCELKMKKFLFLFIEKCTADEPSQGEAHFSSLWVMIASSLQRLGLRDNYRRRPDGPSIISSKGSGWAMPEPVSRSPPAGARCWLRRAERNFLRQPSATNLAWKVSCTCESNK